MRIGIFGTRGVPNHHGGFEQFAEMFAPYLVRAGHEVYVYCSHSHPYQEKQFEGAHLIHCYDPENRWGTVGQFIYDLNCLLDARGRDFDIFLQLGYTSSSVWHPLLPKKPVVITNMDGLEWKRAKYNALVRRFLASAEKWAVKSSDFLIADNPAIKEYLKEHYQAESHYIAYGAKAFESPDASDLEGYGLKPKTYDLIVARMEPENNIETILDGVVASKTQKLCVVVGKHQATPFGRYLTEKFKEESCIRFVGGVYNQGVLDNLRHHASVYFHGHSVGGTNPSLLEAMGSGVLIAAHNNDFNRHILGEEALYFKTAEDVAALLDQARATQTDQNKITLNHQKIKTLYHWDLINQQYLDFFQKAYDAKL